MINSSYVIQSICNIIKCLFFRTSLFTTTLRQISEFQDDITSKDKLIKGILVGYNIDRNNIFLNQIRCHLVAIVSMASFTLKSTSKSRSTLHFRYLVSSHGSLPIANTQGNFFSLNSFQTNYTPFISIVPITSKILGSV